MSDAKNFDRISMNSMTYLRVFLLAAILTVAASSRLAASDFGGFGFATPEEAVAALKTAVAAKDRDQLRVIFGPDLEEISNPDKVQATNEFTLVAAEMVESIQILDKGPDQKIVEYGNEKNLFPVPLVKSENRWFFDTEAGKDELINRRIGRNELKVLDVIRTYVQAQREYASQDRDGDEVLEYAQKFGSTPGQKDGLYWRRDIDGTLSPLGPLAAEAEAAGYSKSREVQQQPFQGYYFRVLTRQGKHAPGGAYDYVINGNMIGGFGLIAWPEEYGETGIMTFIVNQQGRVYQKDIGANTGKTAKSIVAYDPDKSWTPSAD